MSILRTLKYALQSVPFFTKDVPDPKDRILLHKIKTTPQEVIITHPDAKIVNIANTESMNPVIDVGHNAILTKITNVGDLQVGDIITFFRRKDNQPYVMHRIVEIGADSQGWFCVTKGDNTIFDDGKIRQPDVKEVLLGIIY